MTDSNRPSPVNLLVNQLASTLSTTGWRIATAESCTGGGVAAAMTAVAGSSKWFEYGIVAYGNNAKQKLLGVSAQSLEQAGAVSEAVVIEMASGVLRLASANIAVAISGIAGPDGGTADKPVGTVWFAWVSALGECVTQCEHFVGDRQAIQQQAVVHALQGLISLAGQSQKNTV